MPSTDRPPKDLDTIEAESERQPRGGRPPAGRGALGLWGAAALRDLKLYRRLLGYVRPYRNRLIMVVSLSIFTSALAVYQLQILQVGLSSILSPRDKIEAPNSAPHRGSPPVVKRTDFKEQAKETVKELFGGASDRPLTPAERHDKLALIALILILTVVIEQALGYVQNVRMASVMRRVIMDMRMHLFTHLIAQPQRFYDANHTSKLTSRITLELNRFGTFLTSILVDWFRELFTLIGLVCFIILKDGSLLFVIALVLAATTIPIREIGHRLRHRDKASQRGMAEIFAVLQEALTSTKVVKAFGSEEREIERFRQSNRSYHKMMMKLSRLRSATQPLVAVLGAVGLAALMWLGGGRVIDGRSSFDAFMVIVMALWRIIASMRKMGKMSNTFQVGLAAADRVNALLETTPEIREDPASKELTEFKHRIVFRNVAFAYEPGKPVLRGINFVIRKGQTVALVGPSGAGKTTLGDLLLRFYDLKGGVIKIDGVAIQDYTLKSLRSKISIVTQETVLFRHSVRENIAYGRPDARLREIQRAARAANAHDFIMAMPDGYHTVLGEGGVRLSGGEKQRIAIARAILKDAPVLILDEATSSLDSESEVLIQAALALLMRGRTVIVIAHRLATVQRADLIVVIRDGSVEEAGTHEELLAGHGLYARLHRLQSAAGDWEAVAEELGLAARSL